MLRLKKQTNYLKGTYRLQSFSLLYSFSLPPLPSYGPLLCSSASTLIECRYFDGITHTNDYADWRKFGYFKTENYFQLPVKKNSSPSHPVATRQDVRAISGVFIPQCETAVAYDYAGIPPRQSRHIPFSSILKLSMRKPSSPATCTWHCSTGVFSNSVTVPQPLQRK